MITTIITTYRRPHLLKRAVKSVLNQSYSNFQVCVYDNASEDATEAIMKEFEKQDSRVKYFRHEKNIGMMANYEYAISRINTPFFSLLSDDDFLLPCFYETALKGFNEFPDAAFITCDVLIIKESGQIISNSLSLWEREGYYSSSESLMSLIDVHGKLPIPTATLFQHKYVKEIKPDLSTTIQPRWDSDYFLQITAQFPIVILKKPCGVFLSHNNSFSTSFFSQIATSRNGYENYLKATDKLLNRILSNPHVPSEMKPNIKKALIHILKCETSIFLAGNFTIKNFYKCLKINKGFSFLFFKTVICNNFPRLKNFIKAILFLILPIIRYIKMKKLSSFATHKDSGISENSFEEYQKYVKKMIS